VSDVSNELKFLTFNEGCIVNLQEKLIFFFGLVGLS